LIRPYVASWATFARVRQIGQYGWVGFGVVLHNLPHRGGEAEAAIAHDYATLMGALIERKWQLGLTNLDVEARGHFATGYADKLFNGARLMGLGTLGRLLDALEVRILVVPVDKLEAPKLKKIALSRPHLDERGKDIKRAAWGRAGGIKRRCLLTPARRRAIAKLGGLARAAKAAAEAEALAARAAAPAPLCALARAKAKARLAAISGSPPARNGRSCANPPRGIAPACLQSAPASNAQI
jgi:hypothetical protein